MNAVEQTDVEPGPAIVLTEVRKRYGDVHAVAGVSLTVQRGEFFGLIGPNGAGKTTLIEIVEGLREPTSGSVSVLGLPPTPRNPALLPRIGVQTQTSAFFVRLTAREHLETVAALYGVPPEAAERTLELVGLTAAANTRVNEVSGGQRQRLAIASALVHDPELLFLDEPTAALDPKARRDLWRLLRDLKAAGKTIVYTTHHLDEAEALCDRVAILVGGAVRALGSPRELIGGSELPTRVTIPAGRISLEQAKELDGADQVVLDDGDLVVETRTPGRVLAALGATGELDGVQTRMVTLEDIYLELTGPEAAR
ncbi:ABC transporter ATP-binding protein [Plantactinospora mayteni]|uniref:ABC transporter ATP-binding protein n=1 Tax=Plantactinospora mayteni TaxID=566021 RepID=A0ABQ4F228_9ACTN|nr:ABC transporter ATP-binding protein [Plantactinospora mayteni]GIH00971.1 ABC transporter ATP-binding protein [Plantactinospora mayteni]